MLTDTATAQTIAFALDAPVASAEARAVADRIRALTATGAAAQPALDVNAVLRTMQFSECEPCMAQAAQDWTNLGHVDWAALVASGATIIEIDPANPGRFASILAVEEEQTADKRIIAEGAAKWRNPPLSLMLMTKTADGHDGAVVCAVIERIVRQGTKIVGIGRFDTGEAGLEAARLVANKVLTGVSIDAGDVQGEVLVTAEDADGVPTDAIARMTALTILGATICPFQAIGSACIAYIGPDGTMAAEDLDLFGADLIAELSTEESAEATLAFVKPHKFVDKNGDGKCDICGEPEKGHNNQGSMGKAAADLLKLSSPSPDNEPADELTAALPLSFAPSMFIDPKLSGPTPITVGADGHVFGHAALWGTCHIGFPGACVTPPRSKTNYGLYLTGSVKLTDGRTQPVGTIAMNASHADKRLSVRDAGAHYDHTGLAAAFVNVGEDAHGIWVSGILRPDLSAANATVLAASRLSGDWRRVGGNLELVSLLSVNTPGFPVAHVEGSEQLSLVAAGYGHVAATAEPVEESAGPDRSVLSSEGFAEGLAEIINDLIADRLATHEAEIAALKADLRPFKLAALREAFAVEAVTEPTAASVDEPVAEPVG